MKYNVEKHIDNNLNYFENKGEQMKNKITFSITAEEAASIVAEKETGIRQGEIDKFLKNVSDDIKEQAKIRKTSLTTNYESFNRNEKNKIKEALERLGYKCTESGLNPVYNKAYITISWDSCVSPGRK